MSLFDIDGGIEDAGVPTGRGKSIDDILESITEGGEVEDEVFESIKSVAHEGRTGPAPESARPSSAPTVVKFECPACAVEVDVDARICPGCGTEFAEGEEQFACPVCDAAVSADATRCPGCGVEFAPESAPTPSPPPAPEIPRGPGVPAGVAVPGVIAPAPPPERPIVAATNLRRRLETARRPPLSPEVPETIDPKILYRELPRLVGEVKPMLRSAKNLNIDIENSKKLINDAIASGKRRNIGLAVRLVTEAKRSLENAFVGQTADRISDVIAEMERAQSTGVDVSSIERFSDEAVTFLEKRNFQGAMEKVAAARGEFEKRAGGYHKSTEAVARAQQLADDARTFGVDTREAGRLISQARDLLFQRNWDQAELCADRATATVMRTLPDLLGQEMKRARGLLLDMKMKGEDLTKPVGILKQASLHLKREQHGEAMRFVRLFQQETAGNFKRRK